MKKEAAEKEFKIPEPLAFGYPFMLFMEFVVDRVPEFQNISGTRKGMILLDAVAAAEKSDDHVVRWPVDLWLAVTRYLTSESFQMPKNYIVRNGRMSDQLVPLRMYIPMADAILEAEDVKQKSEQVASDVEEAN